MYPDVQRDSGVIIPKSLIKAEPRPKTQQKTSRHKRKRIESLNDAEKKLRKLKRVKAQREEWNATEEKGEVVKAWQPKKSRKPRQATVERSLKNGDQTRHHRSGHQRRQSESGHCKKAELKMC